MAISSVYFLFFYGSDGIRLRIIIPVGEQNFMVMAISCVDTVIPSLLTDYPGIEKKIDNGKILIDLHFHIRIIKELLRVTP